MAIQDTLENHLRRTTRGDDRMSAVAATLLAIAAACKDVAELVAQGPLAGIAERVCGRNPEGNPDGNGRQPLALEADRIIRAALRDGPVACLVSEQLDAPLPLNAGAPLVVAVDPLDGCSNIATNAALGSVFSILPAVPGEDFSGALQAGSRQLAAGYCIYGPQTVLVLTLGQGTHMFTLDREAGAFILTEARVGIEPTTREFAIDATNYRYWDTPIRAYVDDCLEGQRGPRGEDFTMRWIASLVAECHRVLVCGGIFLYPADRRPGYSDGRLRLLCQCAPIAFLIEQAGGRATTGRRRILDLAPGFPHARTPLIFGSEREVEYVEHCFMENQLMGDRSQLFSQRGLFRH